jgi:RNA polymerase sigma factor (sigma-70 family)
MSTATPRKRKPRGRLNPDQQQLAVKYLPLARKLAQPMKRLSPSDWEEFESAACLALVEAAEAYQPERHVKFTTFATKRIWGALKDVSRRRHAKKTLTRDGIAPVELGELEHDLELKGRVLGMEHELEVGWGLDAEDALDSWLRKLPKGHAAACRQIYLQGKTHAEAADALGLSPSRITYIHQEAVAMLNGTWTGERPGSPAHKRPN